MRFSTPDDISDIKNAEFEDDFLGRRSFGEALSGVVEKIKDPLVVALDGPWGSGKTFFLKRWVVARNKRIDGAAATVYFDAFEHDYISDPLVSIVAAISNQLPVEKRSRIETVKRFASKVARPGARVALSMISFGATEALNDLGDAAAGALNEEIDDALKDLWKKEEGRQFAMGQFRDSIAALTLSGTDCHSPLVIVVDELDRCRPDYALEVLEVIKHFFAVPQVHFVLGANLAALQNSIKCRYGAEIDAAAYLQKFLSFKVSLPKVSRVVGTDAELAVVEYAKKLGAEMEVPLHLLEHVCRQLKVVARRNNVSLRDVGKILSLTNLLLSRRMGSNKLEGWQVLSVSLLVSKVVRPDIYEFLRHGSISRDDLVSYFDASEQRVNHEYKDESGEKIFCYDTFVTYGFWCVVCFSEDASAEHNKMFVTGLDRLRFGHLSKIPSAIDRDYLEILSLAD